MNISGIKIRWIYAACYEIILPNGKVIVTDPYVTPVNLEGFKVEDFTGADYILCSHTHFDHTSDIGYLAEKYNSKIFVGEMSAPALTEFFDLSYSHIFPVSNNEIFEMEDFTVQCFKSKHSGAPPGKGKPSTTIGTTIRRHNIEGHDACDQKGWIELYNFLITTKNNVRILIVAGVRAFDNIYSVAKNTAPNIIIRQTEGSTAEEYAKVLNRFNAQLAFPNHHESTQNKYGVSIEKFTEDTNKALKELGSVTTFVNPIPYKWVNLSMSVVQE